MKLKGKKLILFNKKYDGQINTYSPIYDKHQNVTGHQWLPDRDEKGMFAQLFTLQDNEWNFKTDLAFSSFKPIFNQKDKRNP